MFKQKSMIENKVFWLKKRQWYSVIGKIQMWFERNIGVIFYKTDKRQFIFWSSISLGVEFISKSRQKLFLLGLACTLHSQDSFITAIHVFLEFNMFIYIYDSHAFFFVAHSNLRIDWLQTCNAFLLVIYTVECACRLYVERSMYVSQPSGPVGGRFFSATAPKKWEMLSHWVVTFMNLWQTNTSLKVRVRFVFCANCKPNMLCLRRWIAYLFGVARARDVFSKKQNLESSWGIGSFQLWTVLYIPGVIFSTQDRTPHFFRCDDHSGMVGWVTVGDCAIFEVWSVESCGFQFINKALVA